MVLQHADQNWIVGFYWIVDILIRLNFRDPQNNSVVLSHYLELKYIFMTLSAMSENCVSILTHIIVSPLSVQVLAPYSSSALLLVLPQFQVCAVLGDNLFTVRVCHSSCTGDWEISTLERDQRKTPKIVNAELT